MFGLNDLPNEVLERVFYHLPFQEVIVAHSRVCKRWSDIILRDTYLSCKKKYYKYRLGNEDTVKELDQLVRNSEITGIEQCLPWILKSMTEWERRSPLKNMSSLYSGIQNHTLYSLATNIIKERFTEMCSSMTAHLTLVALIARDVYHVREIIKVLLSNQSPATSIEATEILYHIASLLLPTIKLFQVPERSHYLIMYALYLHENSINLDPAYFQPQDVSIIPEHRNRVSLTGEQRKIVNFDLASLVNTEGILRIMAYAGTGKTTTLVELCRQNPATRFLLVVFNRSVKEHSAQVFPSNVVVTTAHSLSYRFIVSKYGGHRMSGFELKYSDLVFKNLLTENKFKGFSRFARAAMVIHTLHAFYNSSDQELSIEHTPKDWQVSRTDSKTVDKDHRVVLRLDALNVWQSIGSGQNKVKFGHDSGMKTFQLSEPDLTQLAGRYDVLLLDEAQDMNPAMLDICLSQKKPKIIVGDTHQQIYAFRGAVDALETVVKDPKLQAVPKHTLYLTQSFRFGPEIAFIANSCLTTLKKVTFPPLVGGKQADVVTVSEQYPRRTAVIARTNLRLFEEMVELVCEVEPCHRPEIAFTVQAGDGDPLKLQELEQLEYFRTGQLDKMAGNRRRYFKNKVWRTYLQEVKEANDLENLSKMEIVEKYKEKIPVYVDILLQQSRNPFTADTVKYIFSTVHRFKGLECEVVRLLDDFYIPDQLLHGRDTAMREDQASLKEEYNLLYVALTRAKHRLIINDSVFFTLNKAGYNFESIVPASATVQEHCVRCGCVVVIEEAAGVVQDRVKVHRQKYRKGGFLCPACFRSPKRPVNYTISGIVKEVEIRSSGGGVADTSDEEEVEENVVQIVERHVVGKGWIPSTFNQFYASILMDKANPEPAALHNVLNLLELGSKEVETITTKEWRAADRRAAEEAETKSVEESAAVVEDPELQRFMQDDDWDFTLLAHNLAKDEAGDDGADTKRLKFDAADTEAKEGEMDDFEDAFDDNEAFLQLLVGEKPT